MLKTKNNAVFKLSAISLSTMFALSAMAQSDEPIEILITGGLVEVARDTVGTSTTVISNEEIAKQGAQFASEVLESVPGVTISRSGGAGSLSEVRMRGTESGHTLVLIDGIEANDAGAGSSFDFGNMLAENIERIEVLRGAQSALWGSDAIGGVINIITKSGQEVDGFAGHVAAEAGSFSTQNFSTGLRGNSAGFDYALSLQNYSTDGFSAASEDTFSYSTLDGRSVTTGGNTEEDGYDNTTAHLKLGYTLANDGRIQAVLRHSEFDNEFDSFGDVPVDGDVENTDGDVTYYGLSANFKQMDGKLGHTFRTFGNERNADNTSSSGASESESGKTNYGYQLDYNFSGAENGVSFVLETEEDELDNAFSGARSHETDSVVAEYRFSANNTSAAVNLRYDDNDFFGNNTTWRVALSQQLSSSMRLHSTYGTAVKNPTLLELYGFSPDFVGNPNLEAESSQGGDIGLEFMLANGLIDITYFDLRIDDLISGSGDTAINVDGESKSRGIELTGQFDLTDALSLNTGYTYNDTEDADGAQLTRRPEHELSVGIEAGLLQDALTLGFNLRHVKGFTDITFNPDFSTSFVEMEDFTVADLAARYAISEALHVNARVHNLFDESYEEVLGYGTSQRAYYLGLRYDF